MTLGLLTIHIRLPGSDSLKAKRRRLKPLLTRLQREFNLSVAEIDHHDVWQDAKIACAMISNENAHTQRSLMKITRWIETNWPDVTVISEEIELF